MSPEWITAGCAAITLLVVLIGLALRPFARIHGKLDCLGSDLKDVKDKQRDHDETLRQLRQGQNVLLGAMKGVIPPEVHAVTEAALGDRKVLPFAKE